METTRKLGPIALIAFIAAIVVAVPIFSATSIINGISIPASTNRFSMMSITGRSTKTAATNWHQLTPAKPVPPRSAPCRKVVVFPVTPANPITELPSTTNNRPFCAQLTVAGRGSYTWATTTSLSGLSTLAREDMACASIPYGIPVGLRVSPQGVISGTPREGMNVVAAFVVTASIHNKHFSVALLLNINSRPTYHSSNWGGYDIQSGPFNGVSTTFNVPRATSIPCHPAGHDGFCSEAIWAGVGDYHPSSIIQAGINERVAAGTHKIAHLGAWYELYPTPNLRVNLPIHQGDQISVNIHKTVTPNLWMIQITNNTTGQTFSTLQFYTGSTNTAEWIVEAPHWGHKQLTLPALTPVTFTHSKYSLAPAGKVSGRTNNWVTQNHVWTTNSLVSPSGAFTVSSSSMNNN